MMLLGFLIASWTYYEFFVDMSSFGGGGNKEKAHDGEGSSSFLSGFGDGDDGNKTLSSKFGGVSSVGGDKDGAATAEIRSMSGGSIYGGQSMSMSSSMENAKHFSRKSPETKIAKIKRDMNDESVKKDILEVIKFQHMFGFATPCITGKVVGNDTRTKTMCDVTSDHLIWSKSSQSPEACFATFMPIAEDHRCDMIQEL